MMYKSYLYIWWLVLTMLSLLVLGKLISDKRIYEDNHINISIIMPSNAKYNLPDLLEGIRDNAREKNVQISMVYLENENMNSFQEVLAKERSIGAEALFIIYPEDFVRDYGDKSCDANLPILILSRNDINAINSAHLAVYDYGDKKLTANSINKDDVYLLLKKKINKIVVPAEYQMGYRCIDNLSNCVRFNRNSLIIPEGFFASSISDRYFKVKGLQNVHADVLEITAKDIEMGKFTGLLEYK